MLDHTHNGFLVLISIGVASLAGFAALDLSSRIAAAPSRWARARWIAASALAMGIGIWSMHFVAMLALRLDVPISYSIPPLVLSVLIAISASAITFIGAADARSTSLRLAAASLAMGPAIAGMHYTGMTAMRMPARVEYDLVLVALSVLIAVAASFAALLIARRFRRPMTQGGQWKTAAAAVMGAAVYGMHYTGMMAARFYPAPAVTADASDLIASDNLAWVVVAGALIIISLTLFAGSADRRIVNARERLAAIVESSDDAIISKDLNGTITSWNRGAEQIFGYSARETIGQPVTMLFPADRLDEEPVIMARITRGERIDHYETVRRRKDGSLLDISLTVSPIRNSNGTIVGASKIGRDITHRKRVEALIDCQLQTLKMAATGAPLQRVLESLAQTVERLSPERVLVAIHLLDKTGTHFEQVAAPSLVGEYSRITTGMEIATDTGPCCRAVTTRLRVEVPDVAGGKEFPAFAAFALPQGIRAGWSAPILSTVGEVLGTVAYYFPAVREPEPLDEVLGEIVTRTAAIVIERGQVEKALEDAKASAEGASRAKSDFLAAMSHELRTPLNAITGYVELLKMGLHGPITDKQDADLDRIASSGRHLLTLINEILDLAKIESGLTEYVLADVQLGNHVRDVQALLAPQFTAKNITYEYRATDPGLTVRADPNRLRQILLNLFSNAIKFTPDGGRISVECAQKNATVFLDVTDTGVGIPPDQLQRIFEPFVQVERRLTNSSQGVGLGLAISRDLARAMDGDLCAVSAPNVGSTFTLSLPFAPAKESPVAEIAVALRAG